MNTPIVNDMDANEQKAFRAVIAERDAWQTKAVSEIADYENRIASLTAERDAAVARERSKSSRTESAQPEATTRNEATERASNGRRDE